MKAVPARPDKRRMRGEESRKLILKAAVDSIAMSGLGKLTLDRVADRVGISRGLVVFHFKSKDNLIEEVLDYLGKKYSGGWIAILDQEAESDMAKLLQLVDYDIKFACDNPKYVSAWHAFWGESRGSVMYQEKVVQREEGYVNDMQKIIENMCAQGQYEKQDSTLVSRGLFAMMFGIWVQLHLNPGKNDYKMNTQAVRLYLSKVFPGQTLPEAVGL